MNKKRRFLVWILPILGIILGIGFANLYIRGAFSTWGKASTSTEKISRIIGDVDEYNLLVETVSGETLYVQTTHCWIYDNNGSQRGVSIQSQPEQDYAADYPMWPLPSRVKQTYDIYYYSDGPKGLERFALTEDGELWYWNFCDSGWLDLGYCIFHCLVYSPA